MKLICDCGSVTEIAKTEDSSYTEQEGWYADTSGPVHITESHDQVFFYCNECGAELWIFT